MKRLSHNTLITEDHSDFPQKTFHSEIVIYISQRDSGQGQSTDRFSHGMASQRSMEAADGLTGVTCHRRVLFQSPTIDLGTPHPEGFNCNWFSNVVTYNWAPNGCPGGNVTISKFRGGWRVMDGIRESLHMKKLYSTPRLGVIETVLKVVSIRCT
ncbi:hypothetical protein J6590_000203 [Homalodisca vitripennis]|nr:hypothetical protein J6590_000203 [Homalodisca vitripennis]